MNRPYAVFLWIAIATLTVQVPLSLGLASAQTKRSSIIALLAAKFKADTSQVNQMLQLADRIKYIYPDSARSKFHEAMQLSKSLRYNDGVAWAFLKLGLQATGKGEYKESQFFFEQAFPYCKKAMFDKTLMAAYYGNMSLPYFYQGDYKEANRYLHCALGEMRRNNIESAYTVMTYNNLATIQYRLQQYVEALSYLNQGEAIGRKKGLTSPLAFILSNKGNVYSDQHQIENAKKNYEESLKFARESNNIQIEASDISNLGSVLIDEHNYLQAIDYLKKAISIANKADLPYVSIASSYNLGEAYYKLKDYPNVTSVLLPAINKAEQLGMIENLQTAHKTLSAAYSALNENKLAYQHLQKAWKLKDSLMGKEKTDAINTLEVKYRTSEKDKEIAKKQLQITTQERNLARKNLWIASISATTLLLSGLAIGLYRTTRHKQRLQAAQIKTLEQEKDLRAMQSMILGEEKERARMARELHDGIGGMLTSVEMHFGILEKRYEVLQEAKDYNEAMQALQDTTAEVRKTAHNLMPEMLLRHGLPEAIRIFCARVTKGEQLEIDFQNIGETKKLDGNFELSLYRIVQELVQNIIRHAHASQALVQLSWHAGLLTLLVEDNGNGLLVEQGNGEPGLGLENLNWRVRSMKGQLTIESTPETGTSIYLEFDLNSFKNLNS